MLVVFKSYSNTPHVGLMRSFCYAPDASFSEECLLQS